MDNKYSWLKGVKKSLTMVAIFGIPLLLNIFPDIANLTIGGILVMFVNYLKVKSSK